MSGKENRLPQIYKTNKANKEKNKIIENRACSSLVELSNNICEAGENQRPIMNTQTSNFTLFSPWKSKAAQIKVKQIKTRKMKSTLYELQSLKNAAVIQKKKKSPSRSLHRTKTEGNSLPASKVVKNQSCIEPGPVSSVLKKLQSTTYASQQVLHITGDVNKDDSTVNSNTTKQKAKLLKLKQSQISCKLYNKGILAIENNKEIISNKLADENRHQRIILRQCAKRKKLKRMFAQSKNSEEASFMSKQQLGATAINSKCSVNPVSRTLLEKYLLLTQQKSFKEYQ